VIAEYLNGALSNEYIYMGDQLVATHSGTALTYHHRDHLSVRVNTEGTSGAPNFGQIVGEQGHYPMARFGIPQAPRPSTCSPATSGIPSPATTTRCTVTMRTVWGDSRARTRSMVHPQIRSRSIAMGGWPKVRR
jgi:hypothetical protein